METYRAMIIRLCAFALWLGFSASAVRGQEWAWRPFSPPDSSWSILVPGEMQPDEEARRVGGDKGSWAYSDFNGFLGVIYRDSPRRLVPWKPNYTAYYRRVTRDIVKANSGEVIDSREFSVGGSPGKEVKVRFKTGTMVGTEGQTVNKYRVQRFRMFFVGKRFYMLLAVLRENEISTPAVDRFFDSFAPTR